MKVLIVCDYFKIDFNVYRCFPAYTSVHSHACLSPEEARRGHRMVWTALWVQRIEPRSPARAASTLNFWYLPRALWSSFKGDFRDELSGREKERTKHYYILTWWDLPSAASPGKQTRVTAENHPIGCSFMTLINVCLWLAEVQKSVIG